MVDTKDHLKAHKVTTFHCDSLSKGNETRALYKYLKNQKKAMPAGMIGVNDYLQVEYKNPDQQAVFYKEY